MNKSEIFKESLMEIDRSINKILKVALIIYSAYVIIITGFLI